MGRNTPCVFVAEDAIERIEALVHQLPANRHVVLLLSDGSSCDGVVSVRPSVQVFRDPQGREGINAEVQLQRPDVPAWHQRVWLDRIRRVESVDSIMPGEN
ncbi:DUF3247 family protein [Rhodanobacter lindaniclasticus]|uniref:DUF3247 domain-containing protein n=1 Tax=Rhodanobacter lindaniclasticus TaxID=75310 RepID=A0A4S3KK43_9GAMM|nr:DUF3247 family protein [Rhodanobacter lindaniclasticus]THD09193.1 hypothetical protein B1991_03275 [Rhodanobacter lindaniclasticus]